MNSRTSDLIFDIGCHAGEDSDFYLKKGFRVVAVEANPDLCSQLKTKFADQIAAGQFTLVEKAVADKDGEVEFYTSADATIWGTIKPDWAKRNEAFGVQSIKAIVPATSFLTLIKQYGVPHYLKIDIEGADMLCIDGLFSILSRPTFLSTEIESKSALVGVTATLRRLGYTKFQLVDQGAVPKQCPPLPAREGNYAHHEFCGDASGLFGNELPSVWTTRYRAIAGHYLTAARNKVATHISKMPIINSVIGNNHHWYDLHAAL